VKIDRITRNGDVVATLPTGGLRIDARPPQVSHS